MTDRAGGVGRPEVAAAGGTGPATAGASGPSGAAGPIIEAGGGDGANAAGGPAPIAEPFPADATGERRDGAPTGELTGDTLPLRLPELPAKEFFKIGEVASIVGVKTYVLRYWESEFKRDIHPQRTRTNQRMYRRRDVEVFLEIKRLRYEEKLQLPGARRKLRGAGVATAPQAALAGIARRLKELLRTVDEDEKRG